MSSQRARVWPVYLLALPAFVSVWSGWVGLGEKTGFGQVKPLPGIADQFQINTAITLPIGVETYAAYALHVWLSRSAASPRARRFAKVSAIGSLLFAACGQVAYHVLEAEHAIRAPRAVIVLVSCLPVLVLGMGAALAHLVRAGNQPGDAAPSAPAEVDPATVELLATIQRQARDARRRVMLGPTVRVGHDPRVGRLVAAPVAAEPASSPATVRPVGGQDPGQPPATEASDLGREVADEVADEVTDPGDGEPAKPRPLSGQEAARRVAKIVARKSDVTAAEVAARLDIPERTARRHLARARAQQTTDAGPVPASQ